VNAIAKILIVLGLLLVPACTIQKVPEPVDGSRAHGTVILEYSVYFTERAEVDYAAAQEKARKICAGWGYAGATPLGGGTERCARGHHNCNTMDVRLPYQCTGAPATR
jgi:hypothetical protein